METSDNPEPELRDPANKDLDKSALQAIAQATINVELFTIPLYMVSMYSIQGMHQITSKGNDFYQDDYVSTARETACSCTIDFRFAVELRTRAEGRPEFSSPGAC